MFVIQVENKLTLQLLALTCDYYSRHEFTMQKARASKTTTSKHTLDSQPLPPPSLPTRPTRHPPNHPLTSIHTPAPMHHPLPLYAHLFTASFLLTLTLIWHLSSLADEYTQPDA
jgi:hypothetical protein